VISLPGSELEIDGKKTKSMGRAVQWITQRADADTPARSNPPLDAIRPRIMSKDHFSDRTLETDMQFSL
jgi:hypothetical protein